MALQDVRKLAHDLRGPDRKHSFRVPKPDTGSWKSNRGFNRSDGVGSSRSFDLFGGRFRCAYTLISMYINPNL